MFDIGVGADNHDVGRGSKFIDEAYKFLIANDHGLELVVGLDATKLELLDDVWNLLEAVIVLVIHGIEVRDHQKGAALKQDNLISSDCWTEAIQAQLKLVNVGEENAHDLGPGFVESFIPDWCAEALCLIFEVVGSGLHNAQLLFREHLISHVFSYQVHFVNQHEYLSILRQVSQRAQTVHVML